MQIEQENGLKPHFGPFLALIGQCLAQISFFLENRALSLFSTHRRLTCCKKSEKSYDGKYEDFMDRRLKEELTYRRKKEKRDGQGQTDRRNLLHRTQSGSKKEEQGH